MAPQANQISRTKSVLFCQECGHESPIDGDWNRSCEDGRSRYSCPTCGHAVTERPTGTNAGGSDRSTESPRGDEGKNGERTRPVEEYCRH